MKIKVHIILRDDEAYKMLKEKLDYPWVELSEKATGSHVLVVDEDCHVAEPAPGVLYLQYKNDLDAAYKAIKAHHTARQVAYV